MKRATSLLLLSALLVSSTGCLVRPNAGAGFDEPGYHPQSKVAFVVPPGSLSNDARVAAVQVGLALATAAVVNGRTGVGSSPAPHVPGRAGVVKDTGRAHPNAYLPQTE